MDKPSILGTDVDTHQPVTLAQEERVKGLYVIGKTGSGKTTLLVNMILQDIEAGRGLCFFDTHGDAITDILRRLPPGREEDVLLLDLLDRTHTFGVNLFQCNDPTDDEEVSRVTSSIMDIFAKLFTESGDLFSEAPTMAETLQYAIPVLLVQPVPMTMAELPLLLMDETARMKLLAPVTNPAVVSFWNSFNRWNRDQQAKLIDSTRRRVGNFILNPFILQIVGQAETTIPFRRLMDEKKIVLVKLSRQHEMVTSLIGSLIVAHIAEAAFSRSDTPEYDRVPFYLFADEYQRFSTPTFADLLAEVRKFKIGTCVAHQWRSQLDSANRGATLNAANMVVYQVLGEDAEELAKQFIATPPEPEDEEIGLEEERAPVKDVFGSLLTKGAHINPAVNAFAQGTLRKMEQKSREYDPCREALPQLNTIFFNAMIGLAPRLDPALFRSFSGLLGFGGYYFFDISDHTHYLYPALENCFNNDFSSFASLNIALWNATRDIEQRYIHGRRESIEEAMNTRLAMSESFKYRSPQEFTHEYSGVSPDAFAKWFARYAPDRPWIRITPSSLRWEEIPNPTRFGDRWKLSPGQETTWYAERDLRSFVDDYVAAQKTALRAFVTEIHTVMQALNAVPIEQGTGQYVKKMRPGTKRTYADMVNEIASRLANPEKPFTARVKLGTEEHTIEAERFPPAQNDTLVAARIEHIRENTREHYCMKREDIKAAIVARQNELVQLVPQKPTTTKEDDDE